MTFDSTSDPPVYFEQTEEAEFTQRGLDASSIPFDFVPMAGDVGLSPLFVCGPI